MLVQERSAAQDCVVHHPAMTAYAGTPTYRNESTDNNIMGNMRVVMDNRAGMNPSIPFSPRVNSYVLENADAVPYLNAPAGLSIIKITVLGLPADYRVVADYDVLTYVNLGADNGRLCYLRCVMDDCGGMDSHVRKIIYYSPTCLC